MPNEADSKSPNYMPLAIVAGCLLIAGAIFATGGIQMTENKKDDDPAVAGEEECGELPEPQEVEISIDDDPVLGDPNAPLTMIEFSDATCGYCGCWFVGCEGRPAVFPEIKKNYIDTGKLKFVFRDLALHGDAAAKAAEAAQCANDQGKFWEFWRHIFGNQQTLSEASEAKKPAAAVLKILKKWAKRLGLRMPDFDRCFDKREYKEEVEKDGQDAQDAGVMGTPNFFLFKSNESGTLKGTLKYECQQGQQVPVFESEGGIKIEGAYPWEDVESQGQTYQGFKTMIEAKLAE